MLKIKKKKKITKKHVIEKIAKRKNQKVVENYGKKLLLLF